jgi:putative peptidoglycan lipid II flippase
VTRADVPLLARTLQAFALGLPFFSAFQLITRTYYATQDTRTPALVNIAAGVVTIAVDLLLVVAIGFDVPGLALGHAASYLFATAAGLVLIRRRLGSLDARRIGRTLVRAVPAAIVTAVVAWLVAAGIDAVGDTDLVVWRVVQVTAAVVAGVLVYVVGALMLGLEEVDEVMGALRRRFRA